MDESEEQWPTETMRYEAQWDMEEADRERWFEDFFRYQPQPRG